MLDDPDVVWGVPLPLAVLLHPLFGMDNIVNKFSVFEVPFLHSQN